MNLYVLAILIFSIILILSIFAYIYLLRNEKKPKEVSSFTLTALGKSYTKQQFENTMFEQYKNILISKEDENYTLLKDIVSDDIYNQILLQKKEDKVKQTKHIVSNINKKFCKLINFYHENNLEIARLWISYSSIEYVKGIQKVVNEDGVEEEIEKIIFGSKEKSSNHEYLITFVKNESETEAIICPGCGFKMNILTSSHCSKCDMEILPKKMHWVYIGEEVYVPVSKNK